MTNIYTILLRRPKCIKDPRVDPLYNKGCFGSTGCHSNNILHPKHEEMFRKGADRLCFMQTGSKNIKIVFITPPIAKVTKLRDRLIIKWNPRWNKKDQRPLKYEYGLPLTNTLARKLNKEIPTSKPENELYQHFRTRIKPVDHPNYLLRKYRAHISKMKKKYGNEIFANYNYETFEVKNKPEFYIKKANQHCSKCRDKNCERKEKITSKILGKRQHVCRPSRSRCR